MTNDSYFSYIYRQSHTYIAKMTNICIDCDRNSKSRQTRIGMCLILERVFFFYKKVFKKHVYLLKGEKNPCAGLTSDAPIKCTRTENTVWLLVELCVLIHLNRQKVPESAVRIKNGWNFGKILYSAVQKTRTLMHAELTATFCHVLGAISVNVIQIYSAFFLAVSNTIVHNEGLYQERTMFL